MSDEPTNKIQLTADGLSELKQELEELEKVKLPAVVKRVAAARAHGDLSENAEYHDAKEEQNFTETRISEIRDVLERAVVIKSTNSHTVVGVGSTVVVHLKDNPGKKFTFKIGGEFEADPEEGKITNVSPIGKALMGKKVGEQTVVKAPAGDILYQVDEIK